MDPSDRRDPAPKTPSPDELLDAADVMQAMAEGHCSMGAVSEDGAQNAVTSLIG